MKANATGRRESNGFTLLEILVAAVVLAILVIGLSQATRLGLRAWQMQAAEIATNADLDSTDRLLRSLVEHMDPGSDSEDPQIAGTETTLSFTTEIADPASGVPQPVDATLLRDASDHLVLMTTPHLHAIRLAAVSPRRTVLLSGVAALRIAYWPSRALGRSAGWLRTWQEPALPALVRFHLVFRAGDKRRWPDIVTAPKLQAPE